MAKKLTEDIRDISDEFSAYLNNLEVRHPNITQAFSDLNTVKQLERGQRKELVQKAITIFKNRYSNYFDLIDITSETPVKPVQGSRAVYIYAELKDTITSGGKIRVEPSNDPRLRDPNVQKDIKTRKLINAIQQSLSQAVERIEQSDYLPDDQKLSDELNNVYSRLMIPWDEIYTTVPDDLNQLSEYARQLASGGGLGGLVSTAYVSKNNSSNDENIKSNDFKRAVIKTRDLIINQGFPEGWLIFAEAQIFGVLNREIEKGIIGILRGRHMEGKEDDYKKFIISQSESYADEIQQLKYSSLIKKDFHEAFNSVPEISRLDLSDSQQRRLYDFVRIYFIDEMFSLSSKNQDEGLDFMQGILMKKPTALAKLNNMVRSMFVESKKYLEDLDAHTEESEQAAAVPPKKKKITPPTPVAEPEVQNEIPELELDDILDKISTSGFASLTPEEKKFLSDASK